MVRVIVADDDIDVLESICECLDMHGAKVVGQTQNGLEAIELYKKTKPDVVFLDYSMPKYDGLFALKGIKEFDPASKVVIISANLEFEIEEILRDNGADAVYKKPFDMGTILDQI